MTEQVQEALTEFLAGHKEASQMTGDQVDQLKATVDSILDDLNVSEIIRTNIVTLHIGRDVK